MIQFDNPQGIYFLLLGPLIPLMAWVIFSYRRELEKRFSPEVIIPRSSFNYWGKIVALTLSFLFATLALMGPTRNGRYPLEKTTLRQVQDVIFLVDASASMSVKDASGMTRFEKAKEIVDGVVSRLSGENVALLAFTSEATKMSPLTSDYLFVRLQLEHMEINEGDIAGTDLTKALATLQREYSYLKEPTLIILSDGGELPVHNLAKEANIYTVGIGLSQEMAIPGQPGRSKLNAPILQKLGKQYFASNEIPTSQLIDDLVRIIRKGGKREVLGGDDLIYDHDFQMPLAIALFLLLIVLFFPDTQKVILILPFFLSATLLSVSPAIEADAYFEAGDFVTSEELYSKLSQDSSLTSWQKATALYNKAVAMYYSGDLEGARYTLEQIQPTSPFLKENIEAFFSLIGKPEGDPYLSFAIQWLLIAGEEKTEEPIKTLERAIQRQEFALKVHRQGAPLSWIQKAQNETLEIAKPFYNQVLAAEIKEYPLRCQCHPWDLVIPPFEEGYVRAKWNLINMAVQHEILRYWKQSLKNVTKQEESKPEAIKDVIRELQSMDQEDQLPKLRKTIIKEGIHPW